MSLKAVGWRIAAAVNATLGIGNWVPGAPNAVMMYHAVGGGTGNWRERVFDADAFRRHLEWLSTEFELVDLPDVLEPGTDRRVAITFDDGYRSFATDALPVLREFDAPATCFVIADRVGGETERGVPYLDADAVSSLAASDLVTVGNHTRTHAHLASLDAAGVRDEVVGAKAALESQFDCTVDRFCYPYGEYTPAVVKVVRESHAYATADDGLVTPDTDPFVIPRVDGSQPPALVRWELTPLAERLRDVA